MRSIFEDINLSATGSTRLPIEERHFCLRRIIALARACSTSSTDFAFHIKKIRIDNLDARDHAFEQLLPYMRRLSSLSLNYELVHFEDPEDMRISITRLATALEVQASSLTQLTITHSYTTAITSGLGRNRPPMPLTTCSWTHLTVLEKLDIPPSALLGWRVGHLPPLVDVFPTSLVQLHFGKDIWWQPKDDPFHRILSDLVERENWRRITPELKNVSCHLRAAGSLEKLQSKRNALRELLERNGLHYNEDIRRIMRETGGLEQMDRRDLLEAEGIDLSDATSDVGGALWLETKCPLHKFSFTHP